MISRSREKAYFFLVESDDEAAAQCRKDLVDLVAPSSPIFSEKVFLDPGYCRLSRPVMRAEDARAAVLALVSLLVFRDLLSSAVIRGG